MKALGVGMRIRDYCLAALILTGCTLSPQNATAQTCPGHRDNSANTKIVGGKLGDPGKVTKAVCGMRYLAALFLTLVWAVVSVRAYAEKRIALVITNQAYTQAGARLTNTHRDGELVKAALESVGFQVWVSKDTDDDRRLLQAIAGHVGRLAEAGPDAVGFFYYSGHGAADRPNGENYLIPTEVPLTHASQLPLMAVQLNKVTSTLANAGRMSFVVFDACRNVPLQRDTKDISFKGFVPVPEQNGLLVAFATEPGKVAIDQSLYASALAEAIATPGLEAGQVFRRVRLRVRADTGQTQSPEYLDKRDQDFHFVSSSANPAPILKRVPEVSEVERAWRWVKDTTSETVLQDFLIQFGNTSYGAKARARLEELKKQAAVAAPRPAIKEDVAVTAPALPQVPIPPNVFFKGRTKDQSVVQYGGLVGATVQDPRGRPLGHVQSVILDTGGNIDGVVILYKEREIGVRTRGAPDVSIDPTGRTVTLNFNNISSILEVVPTYDRASPR
jgi:hypothetical protein